MTSPRSNNPMPQHGSYELVDNVDYGSHQQALIWLAEHYPRRLNVATGFIGLEGLDELAKIAAEREQPTRLLIGAAPEALAGPPGETVADRFQQSVSALRRQRDFSAFPAARRAVLERVTRFFESNSVEVRRYIRRFLHGKAYVIGELNEAGSPMGPGAALVSSANLTQGGLVANLELGMVHYQPNVVGMALGWHRRLWNDAQDFREELLELLRPPSLESDPQTVNERFADGTPVKFPEPELQERRYDLDSAHPGIVQAMEKGINALKMARYRLSSPSYRTDSQGESASEEALAGLIQSQLLKRFESSWYAALQTVNRMRDGNDVMLRVIAERGLAPPPEVIRDLVGDSAEDDTFLSADLIDEALAGSEGGIPADKFNDQFLADLQKDRDSLAAMSARLESLKDRPDPKLDTLKEVMAITPSQKVAVFTAFQDTAAYLKERVESQPDLLGDREWTVVIGSETSADARTRELERFCPESVRDEPGFRPDGGEVDVIISTDILSEGQNLQQAQAVLSFDMPWNPQRVVQRNGRIIRLGSPHDTAYLYTLLPKQGELDRLLKLEAKLQAKIMAANASVGMETPALADVEMESQVYADLSTFVERLSGGDATVLDQQEIGSAFAGEVFRSHLRRAAEEGEVSRLRGLPWGIGAAFVQWSPALAEPAVFFTCRTRRDERYWRMVSQSGEILYREDLPMLRLIDPQEQPGCPIPDGLDLERLFAVAADDICTSHNALLDPETRFASLPASQRWALDVLRSPDAPAGAEYDDGDQALSAGRNNLVRRELSELRREYEDGGISVGDCARRIIEVVAKFGLRPVQAPQAPEPITEDDLGVVCYQVVLPS